MNGALLSSVDEREALDVDADADEVEEHERRGRVSSKERGVETVNESFSIWLRLKSEKCFSIVDLNGRLAAENDGSARTMCRTWLSLLFFDDSGDENDFE